MGHKMSFHRASVYIVVGTLFAFTFSVMLVFICGRIEARHPNLRNYATNYVLNLADKSTFFDNDSAHKSVIINWSERYPFAGAEYENLPHTTSTFENVVKFAKKIQNSALSHTQESLIFRHKYVEAVATMEKIMGISAMKKKTPSSYAILDGDYLAEYDERIDISAHARALSDFQRFLQGENIDFLYVQAPDKVCKSDDIANTRDFANQNADDLLCALERSRTPYLDLRDEIHKGGLVHHDLFFKTDHHWKPETGLWATKIIAEGLNDSFGFNIDTSLYDPGRYDYKVYDGNLGSIGRRATLAVARQEPFTCIFPKFEVDLTIQIPSRNLDKRGDFTVIYYEDYWKYVLQEENAYLKDYYNVYLYMENPTVSVQNNSLGYDEKRVLMISDSFNRVVAPFLTLSVSQIDILALNRFTGSVKSFIEQNRPDVVIVMYCPRWIARNKSIDYKSHTSFFDFR
ncbi:MAG: hypothetical protein LBI74_00675 [Synergistaceae bacterium]|jgi:hypothetical protein|nr:hypothetical protein [Synergistaceae bacterium]